MDPSDFLKQIPIQILLAPFVFGGMYIVLMAFIVRRSRKRKQEERERAEAILAGQEPPTPAAKTSFWQSLPLGNFLRGELPNRPLAAADWTVPSELRNLPEPDLDMLAMPTNVDQNDSESVIQATTPATVSAALEHSAAAVRVPQHVTGAVTDKKDNGMSKDYVEVMRIYRHLEGGGLILEMGNQRYSSAAEIQKADLTRRFTGLVNELASMTNELQEDDVEAVIPNSGDKSVNARMGLLKGQPEPPKRDFIHSFARAAMAQTDVEENTAGIANAVEEFLQFKLSNTPQFAERSIHIRSGRDHAISIEVDGHYYDAIGDVVDPDVREYLLGMMREWEARH